MKQQSESGKTLTEVLAVLAIMAILTIGSIVGFRHLTMKQKVNDIINTINLGSVQILSALMVNKMPTPDAMDAFLQNYATTAGGYNINFKAPRDTDREFSGSEFIAEITDSSGQRIKGAMCRLLMTTMVRVQGVSDIDFTVRQEPTEDGTVEDITMRLSGKAVDLNALCGSDIF